MTRSQMTYLPSETWSLEADRSFTYRPGFTFTSSLHVNLGALEAPLEKISLRRYASCSSPRNVQSFAHRHGHRNEFRQTLEFL